MKARRRVYFSGRSTKVYTSFAALKRAGKPEHIVIEHGTSSLFTMYRPPRPKHESPAAYFRRLGCVDDRYFHVHKGRYYCNPAHCKSSWKSKAARDEHLKRAYGLLS